MADDSYSLYDAGKDAIDLNYDFDNAGAQALIDKFNNLTPQLMKLYERREFLTFFFIGDQNVPLLTPKQAIDFKLTYKSKNFPANGLQSYMDWRDEADNGYKHAFPYPILNGDGDIEGNKWRIAYLKEIDNDLWSIVNNQHNYSNWVEVAHNSSWEAGTDLLVNYTSIRNTFAKIAALFAMGKAVPYYNAYIKPTIDIIANGSRVIFDPLTGLISVDDTIDSYTIPFTDLYTKKDRIAIKLYHAIGDKTGLQDHQRLFCIICCWLARCYNTKYIPEKLENKITTYWDFTPIVAPKQYLPYDPYASGPNIITRTHLLDHIRILTATYISQWSALYNTKTSFKTFWNGAIMRNPSNNIISCPFFFVIHVNFDSIRKDINPFYGPQLTQINDMIRRTMDLRDKMMSRIYELFKNVTVNKSCSSTIIDMSTVIFDEGSSNNQQINSASCVIDSVVGEDKKTGEDMDVKPEKNPAAIETVDDTVIENIFTLTDDGEEEEPDDPSEPITPPAPTIIESLPKKALIAIAVIIVLLCIWCIFLTIRVNRCITSLGLKNKESNA